MSDDRCSVIKKEHELRSGEIAILQRARAWLSSNGKPSEVSQGYTPTSQYVFSEKNERSDKCGVMAIREYDDVVFIQCLFVDDDQRRQRHGETLVREAKQIAIQRSKACGLATNTSNTAMRSLAEKEGFYIEQERDVVRDGVTHHVVQYMWEQEPCEQ